MTKIGWAQQENILTIIGFSLFLTVNAFTIWGGFMPTLQEAYQATAYSMALFIPQSLALVFTLLGCSLFAGYIAPGASCLGLALSGLFLFSGAASLLIVDDSNLAWLMPLSGIALGIGSAGFYLLWEMILTAQKREQAETNLLSASALFPCLFFLLSTLFRSSLAKILLVIIALSFLLLLLVFRHADMETSVFRHPPRTFIDNHHSMGTGIWQSIICVSSLGFVSGIVRTTGIANTDTAYLINIASMIGVVISALVLLLLWKVLKIRFDLPRFYQIIFPLVAAGFVLLPFMGNTYHCIFAGIAYFTFSLVSMFMMLTCADISRQRQVHPTFVYGLFAGFVYLVMGVGSTIGSVIGSLQEFGVAQMAMIALFTLYLLSLVLLVSRSKRGSTDNPQIVVVENTRDILTEKCSILAQRSSLSPREAEIMELIVRGRDVPYIASALFISENTVRSHSKNIYRKVNVHNKQELMDDVENSKAI